MMIDWLGAIEGEELASRVADSLVHTRHMNHPGEARVPAGSRYGVRDARVIAAVELMEEHLEECRSLSQIAAALKLSERQLERLFRRELGSPPLAFYRRLRLERAEQLLLYSRMSVREVGLAAGFSSLALFSRAFKAQYGRAPSSIRRPASGGSRQPATAA
jgi:AraC family carnitine catabolism transcriptional activator